MKTYEQPVKPATPPNSKAFTHQHYVPLLKSKSGELWALERVKDNERPFITPLLEVHREGTKTVPAHVSKVMTGIKRAWQNRTFFLDTILYGVSGSDSVANAATIFQLAEGEQLSFVPVTSLGRSLPYQAAVSKHVGRGAVIRLSPQDFEDPELLSNGLILLMDQLNLPPEQIDILLDYGSVTVSGVQVQLIRLHVNLLPSLEKWRTLTVAGGSFPASLASRSPNAWHTLPREEWAAWQLAVGGSPKLKRLPAYGDYGVRDTQPPAEFGSPYANIRYTTGGLFLVRRHDVLFRNGGSDGIFAICESLVERDEFAGAGFSAGDERIETTAAEQQQPGNPGSWTQWGMSHHFSEVVAEIQSLLAA